MLNFLASVYSVIPLALCYWQSFLISYTIKDMVKKVFNPNKNKNLKQ